MCALLAPICEAVCGAFGSGGHSLPRGQSRAGRVPRGRRDDVVLASAPARGRARGVAGEPGVVARLAIRGALPGSQRATLVRGGRRHRRRSRARGASPRAQWARRPARIDARAGRAIGRLLRPRRALRVSERVVVGRLASLLAREPVGPRARPSRVALHQLPRARGGETLHGRWQVSLRKVTPEAAKGARAAVAAAERLRPRMIRSLLPYVWPADKPDHRARRRRALPARRL